MGFLDRHLGPATGTNEHGIDPDELKGWTVRYSPANGKGGWAKVDGWELISQPPTRTEFSINTGELEPGTYRLFWIQQDTERLQTPPDDLSWKLSIEGDVDDGEEDRLDRIERQIQALASGQQQDDGPKMPDDPDSLIQWMTLNDPEMFARYADVIVPAAFGANPPGGGIDYESFEENPIGALLFDAYNNPEKLRKAGENLGAGFGSGLDGFFRGMEDPESIDTPDVQDDVQDDADEEEQPREFGPGATVSLDQLQEGQEGAPDLDDWLAARESAEDGESGPPTPAEGETPDEPPADEETGSEADESNEEEPDLDEDLSDSANSEIDQAVDALEVGQ